LQGGDRQGPGGGGTASSHGRHRHIGLLGRHALEALVACAGVTLNSVATALGIALRDATVHAEGDLDFRGTLGVDKEAPVGFKNIRLRFELDTDASPEQRAKLLQLTERYCVVYQTLRQPPPVQVSA
jgi:uncharacterized OsmC-like protein